MADKKCIYCKAIKPLKAFRKRSDNNKYYVSYCKECDAEIAQEYRQNNKSKIKYSYLKRTYGHCHNFDTMMERYDETHNCDCCNRPFGDTKSLAKCVDHSGDTIRGFICNWCNRGIGMLGDNIIGIENALKYLKEVEHE